MNYHPAAGAGKILQDIQEDQFQLFILYKIMRNG